MPGRPRRAHRLCESSTPSPTASITPAPSLFGITRPPSSRLGNEPARFFNVRRVHATCACRRTRTSPGPATGVSSSPILQYVGGTSEFFKPGCVHQSNQFAKVSVCPSTDSACPEIFPALSDAKNTTVSAISCGATNVRIELLPLVHVANLRLRRHTAFRGIAFDDTLDTRSIHASGAYRVDSNFIRPELHRPGLGQPNQSPLAGRIGRAHGRAKQPCR